MDIIVKITDSSSNTGPTFNLYSNVDNYNTAFVTNVSKASLLSGYYTNLAPANTATVRVKSVGPTCNNYIDVSVLPTTTTTTTTYPVTVDFTLEILTSYLYANPAVFSYQYTGAPSGKYRITAEWASTKEEASNPYAYSTVEYTNFTYLYSGANIPPTNNGFPPGTYWFGVRDFDNYLNMKVKSITILPPTTTTTTTAPTLTPILVYINFTSGSVLCTNPTSEASLTVYCTTSTLQANSKIYYSNGTNSPAANGLYVSAGLVSGVPGPVFRVIDNAGTLAAHNCSTTTTTTTISFNTYPVIPDGGNACYAPGTNVNIGGNIATDSTIYGNFSGSGFSSGSLIYVRYVNNTSTFVKLFTVNVGGQSAQASSSQLPC